MNYSLLPAWRWSFPSFHTQFGISDAFSSALMAGAQVLVALASVVWYVVLWLVQVATQTDLLASAERVVDQGFADVANPLLGSGSQTPGLLLGAVAFVIVTYVVVRAARGQLGYGVRAGLRAFVPLALLVVIANAARVDVAAGSPGTTPLSPAWLTARIDAYAAEIGAAVPALVGQVDNMVANTTQPLKPPDCAAYIAALDAKFKDGAQAAGPLGQATAAIPVAVSDLWQRSLLYAWEYGQFGDPVMGQRVGCRALENQKQEPVTGPAGQADLTNAAAGACSPGASACPEPSVADCGVFGYQIAGGDSCAGAHNVAYAPFTGDDATRAITAWMACWNDNGTWKLTPAFTGVNYNGEPQAGDCATWWNSGAVTQGGAYPSGQDPWGIAVSSNTSGDVANATKAAPAAGVVLQSWNGHNASNALLVSIVAMASSVAYGVALGGLSLGTVIAQLLLVFALMLLPLLLLAMALPGERGHYIAVQAFKIALGAAVAKVVFTFVLGVLVDFINVLNSLSLGAAGGGIGGILLTSVTPLLAVFALHHLLKQFGMAGVLSIKGAMATTASITAATPSALGRWSPSQLARRAWHSARERVASRGEGAAGSAAGAGTARPPSAGLRTDTSRHGEQATRRRIRQLAADIRTGRGNTGSTMGDAIVTGMAAADVAARSERLARIPLIGGVAARGYHHAVFMADTASSWAREKANRAGEQARRVLEVPRRRWQAARDRRIERTRQHLATTAEWWAGVGPDVKARTAAAAEMAWRTARTYAHVGGQVAASYVRDAWSSAKGTAGRVQTAGAAFTRSAVRVAQRKTAAAVSTARVLNGEQDLVKQVAPPARDERPVRSRQVHAQRRPGATTDRPVPGPPPRRPRTSR